MTPQDLLITWAFCLTEIPANVKTIEFRTERVLPFVLFDPKETLDTGGRSLWG